VAAGPIAPVSRPGQADTRPVRGATIEAMRESKVVAVAHTDKAGRYTLTLPPGTYVILVTANAYLTKRSSKTVSVSAGQTLKVGFVLDTGIR
jgi:carboxypeptidase family protein